MSWSAVFESKETLKAKKPDSSFAIETPEATEQFEVAMRLALDVINSQVLGNPTDYDFKVGINGHANPDHKPHKEWSNNFLVINVYQKNA